MSGTSRETTDEERPPIKHSYLLRVPKEAIVIINGYIHFLQNSVGQCCSAWVSMFFKTLYDLSCKHRAAFYVESDHTMHPIGGFDIKRQTVPPGTHRTEIDPALYFNWNTRTGRPRTSQRFSVVVETGVAAPGIADGSILIWFHVFDALFIINEYIIDYLAALRAEINQDGREHVNTSNDKKKQNEVDMNDSRDVPRLLSRQNVYVDGIRLLALYDRNLQLPRTIVYMSDFAPLNAFNPTSVLSRLKNWNAASSFSTFGERNASKNTGMLQYELPYDLLLSREFDYFSIPYHPPSSMIRFIIHRAIKEQFPERRVSLSSIPSAVTYRPAQQTKILPYYYRHCYFVMWRQLFSATMNMYSFVKNSIQMICMPPLSPTELEALETCFRELRDTLLNEFLGRVRTDLQPFENPLSRGNCSKMEHAIWTAPAEDVLFHTDNIIHLAYGRDEDNREIDLDNNLLFFLKEVIGRNLITDFGPREKLRFNAFLFYICAAAAPIGGEKVMQFMCGDGSYGKGLAMDETARLFPPDFMHKEKNLSISYFNNFDNKRGTVQFLDEFQMDYIKKEMSAQIRNHLKNDASDGFMSSNQQSQERGGAKQSKTYERIEGIIQLTGNWSSDALYDNDPALFSRGIDVKIGLRPENEIASHEPNMNNIRILQQVYPIFAKMCELQYIGFYSDDRAINNNIMSVLTRFIKYISRYPMYNINDRLKDPNIIVRYKRLVTYFATLKVMCTSWGYTMFSSWGLTSPDSRLFQAINDQIVPSEQLLVFVLSCISDTFFSDQSYVFKQTFEENYKLYTSKHQHHFFTPVVYTLQVDKKTENITCPIYLRVNVSRPMLFIEIKKKWKIGEIFFEAGLTELSQMSKIVVQYMNTQFTIPAHRAVHREIIQQNDEMQQSTVAPIYFERNAAGGLTNIYVAEDYLKTLHACITNYFEMNVLPMILSINLVNTRVITFSSLNFNRQSYIQHFNYASYSIENRNSSDNSNKRQCTTSNALRNSFDLDYTAYEPLTVFEIHRCNETLHLRSATPGIEYLRTAEDETKGLPMFSRQYPHDAIAADISIVSRTYTTDEINFLATSTVRFKVAANVHLDNGEHLGHYQNIAPRYSKTMATMSEDNRAAFMKTITDFRKIKTEIDDNALNYYMMYTLIKIIVAGARVKNTVGWEALLPTLRRYVDLHNKNVEFDYALKITELRTLMLDLNYVRRMQDTYKFLFDEVLFPHMFEFPILTLDESHVCRNFFVIQTRIMNTLNHFHQNIYLTFMCDPRFIQYMNDRSFLMPNIVEEFFNAALTFIP